MEPGAWLLSLFLLSTAHPWPAGGILCFENEEGTYLLGGKQCSAAESQVATVAGAEPRGFAWAHHKLGRLVVGHLNTSDALPEPATFATLEVRFDGSPSREWPSPTAIMIEDRDGEHSWRVMLTPDLAGRLREIRLPPGSYRMTIESDRHLTLYRDAVVATLGAVTNLGEMPMRTVPRVSGRVVDGETREPIASASVAAPEGNVVAMTETSGIFAFDIDGDVPRYLVVSYPGYGSRFVAPGNPDGDIEVSEVALLRGATLLAEIRQPTGHEPAELWVDLFHLLPGERRPELIEHEKAEAESDVSMEFADLEPGSYFVRVSGAQPLHRLVREVEVASGETVEEKIEITPSKLEGVVSYGKDVLPGARVRFMGKEPWNEAALVADDDGNLTAELWQQGSYAILVDVPGSGVPWGEMRNLEGEEIYLDLQIPDRMIEGTAVDSATGRPISGVSLSLEFRNEQMHSSFSATTEENGHFEFHGARDGAYVLTADAAGYLLEEVRFTLAEHDSDREVDLRLRRAHQVAVRIIDPSGAPAANSVVLAGVTPDGLEPMRLLVADAQGEVAIPGEPGEMLPIFVIPPDASFFAGEIGVPEEPGGDREITTIRIPPGDANMAMRVEDEEGKPVPDVSLLVRYDGYLIPPGVGRLLGSMRPRRSFRTAADGSAVLEAMPAGLYEIWPYRTGAELRSLLMISKAAPVQVGIGPGNHLVRIELDTGNGGGTE